MFSDIADHANEPKHIDGDKDKGHVAIAINQAVPVVMNVAALSVEIVMVDGICLTEPMAVRRDLQIRVVLLVVLE